MHTIHLGFGRAIGLDFELSVSVTVNAEVRLVVEESVFGLGLSASD